MTDDDFRTCIRKPICEELTESQGWKRDPRFPEMMLRHETGAVFQMVDHCGTSVLEKQGRYVIPFSSAVPSSLILAACREAAAEKTRQQDICDAAGAMTAHASTQDVHLTGDLALELAAVAAEALKG